MVAAFRYAPDGTSLTGAYVTPDQLPDVLVDAQEAVVIPGTRTLREDVVILVQVPIDHVGFGRAGLDIVAVSTEPLQTSIRSSARSVRGATVVVAFSDGKSTNVAITSADEHSAQLAHPDVGDESRATAIKRFRTDWSTVVHQSESVLFESVRSDIRLFLVVVIVLGMSAVVVAGLVLGLLSRRTLAETGQLSRIVEEKTGQLTLLLNEVHHRVKNDIMLMNSFLGLKAAQARVPEAQEALADAQMTLLTMGRVYELLHRSGDYGSVSIESIIDGLVDQARGLSGEGRVTIERSVENISVDRRTAVPLAIIANELLTNAIKHSGQEGVPVRVRVTLEQDEHGDVTLVVADSGIPFNRQVLAGEFGFGLRMVQALTEQLGGELTLSNDPEPVVVLRVPAKL
jgi:two-component sensor histidine kinase